MAFHLLLAYNLQAITTSRKPPRHKDEAAQNKKNQITVANELCRSRRLIAPLSCDRRVAFQLLLNLAGNSNVGG